MRRNGWKILIALVAGMLLGMEISYIVGKSAWAAVAGAFLGALVIGVPVLVYRFTRTLSPRSRRVVGVLIGVLAGASLGGWVGHASAGGQVLATVVGGIIGVVVGAVIVLLLPNDIRWSWTWFDFVELLRSCLSVVVLAVGCVITIAGFMLLQR